MSKPLIFIDEKQLDASVQQMIKAIQKAHDKRLSNGQIRSIFYKNALPIKQAMSDAAPMRKGVRETRSNVTIGKRKGVKHKSTGIEFKGGNLKKSIDRFRAKKSKDLRVEVGPRTKNIKSGMRSGFYGYFQNFGTKRGVTAKGFSEKAFAATQSRVTTGIIEDIEKQVAKMNRELNGAGT